MIAYAILKKEIFLLLRGFKGVFSIFVLLGSFTFLSSYAMNPSAGTSPELLRALKWIFLFSSGYAIFSQNLWEEREAQAGRIVSLYVSPTTTFLIKGFVVWCSQLLSILFLDLSFVLVFPGHMFSEVWKHIFIISISSFAFSLLGISLGSISSATRWKEILLPLLLFPFSIPIFLFGISIDSKFFANEFQIPMNNWILLVSITIFYAGIGAFFQELTNQD